MSSKLYIGNLSMETSEDQLVEIFSQYGPVTGVKVVRDKNNSATKFAFVHLTSGAEDALALNNTIIGGNTVKVNWAFNPHSKGDLFHVFVGDLSPSITDSLLFQAFHNRFPSIVEARVMWDTSSGKSRGYGFVAFREKTEAQTAIDTMNGKVVGNRPVRLNWANQKSIEAEESVRRNITPLVYEEVVQQASAFNSTVYIGNLNPSTTEADLLPLFMHFGYILDIKLQCDRGYAFLKMDSHENAANAICQTNGTFVCGRYIKCSWGKDKGEHYAYSGTVYYPHPSGPLSPLPLLSPDMNSATHQYFQPMPSPSFYSPYQWSAPEASGEYFPQTKTIV